MAERVRSNTKAARSSRSSSSNSSSIDEVVDGLFRYMPQAVDVADDLIGFATFQRTMVTRSSLSSPARPTQDQDAHALLVHLAGLGAVAATPTSTTCGRCEEADERCVVAGITEDRGGDGDVVKVAGALPGVVRDVDVARVDPFRADVVDEVADGGGHRVDVAGVPVTAWAIIRPSVSKTPPRGRRPADRCREGRTYEGERLFFDDRDEAIPHPGCAFGRRSCVNSGDPASARWISTVPSSCMVATWWRRARWWLSSTITAGPRTWSPAESEVRSTTAASASTPLIGSYIVRWFGAATSVPFVDNSTGVGASTTDATRTDQLTASIARWSMARPKNSS